MDKWERRGKSRGKEGIEIEMGGKKWRREGGYRGKKGE